MDINILNINILKNKLAAVQMAKNNPDFACSTVSTPKNWEDKNKGWGTELMNSAPGSFKTAITTLTRIRREVIGQVHYEVNPNEFVPIKMGDGAFAEETLYYKNFQLAGKFSDGFVSGGQQRKAKVDVGYDTIRLKNQFWVNEFDYSIIELNQANANQLAISLISEKETARKKAWDLGIQETAFVGVGDDDLIDGLLTLNNQGVSINTTVITKPIKAMNPTEFNTFISNAIAAYFANSNSTKFPNCFILPVRDLLGAVGFVAENQPFQSKLEVMRKAFIEATGNPNFQVKAVQYADKSTNSLGVNRYVLYSNTSDSLEMNIPVDYTATAFGTVNNFDFTNVAYGQFSGVIAKRPAEMLYFDHAIDL